MTVLLLLPLTLAAQSMMCLAKSTYELGLC